ncbi:hypothetical protein CK203_017607 [Vitis vinifera]|uniref:Uncharacterized protein n=1 Tax=Vitis vinifera TaxID=29760 RepID=A0A438JHE3_VITVI|nr:hypothetical protein CK203_017607 [Vitis vinifera]
MHNKLNRLDFLRWSQFVKLFIHGKGKLGYLTGAIKAPKEDDLGFQTWDLENFYDHGMASEFNGAGDWTDLHVSINTQYRKQSLKPTLIQKLLMMQLVKGIQRSLKRKGRCGVTIATSLRHTKKCCWKLYETPQNWKCSKFPEKDSQGMQAVAESRPIIETSLFSKEQLEHLYRLFNQSQPSHNSPSCSLPPKGNLRICSLYS